MSAASARLGRRERRALWALAAAAVAARLVYCWAFSPYAPDDPVPPFDRYHELALSVLETGGLYVEGRPTALREPIYPYFLAVVYALGGVGLPAVWVSNALLGGVYVWLLFLLGDRVFGRRVAWGGAAMAAFHPQLVYYTALPLREALQVLVLLGAVLATVAACRRPSKGRFAAIGLLWAACPLINSALLGAALLAPAGVWAIGRRRKTPLGACAGASLAVCLSVYALWPLRNYLVFDRFIPGVALGGSHLYVSLIVPNEHAGTPREAEIVEADPVMQAGTRLTDEERDRHFYGAAARWIRERPLGFVRIMLGSLVKLWRLYPYPRDYGADYRLIKWVSLLSDGWIIPLGFLGLVLAARRVPEAALLNLVLFAITATYMVFWAVVRYRLPMMPYMMLYAAYALERGLLRLRK